MEIDTQTQEYTELLQSEFGNDLISLFKILNDISTDIIENSEGETIEDIENKLLKLL